MRNRNRPYREQRRASLGQNFLTLVVVSLAPLALSQSSERIELPDAGFLGPESVLHDEAADVYLVSNVNGMPSAADGNGFISRVSPEGEVLELRWIDGEAEGVDLDAPKGMAISGNTLFVADITNVRMFDRETGEATGSAAIEGSDFLNDVTPAPDGGVFVTDTGVDASFQPTGSAAVYFVSEDGSVEEVIASPDLGGPNGITTTEDGTILIVTFGTPGQIIRIADGEIVDSRELSAGSLDGVVVLEDGDLLVSSWTESAVLRVADDGSATPVVEGVESPADIDYDAARNQVLIPQLQTDNVLFVPLQN